MPIAFEDSSEEGESNTNQPLDEEEPGAEPESPSLR